MGYWVTYNGFETNGEHPFRYKHFSSWVGAWVFKQNNEQVGLSPRVVEDNECATDDCTTDTDWGREHCRGRCST